MRAEELACTQDSQRIKLLWMRAKDSNGAFWSFEPQFHPDLDNYKRATNPVDREVDKLMSSPKDTLV